MRSSITHPRMLHPLARPPTHRPTHHLRQTPLHHTTDRARPASRRTLLPTGVLSISSSRPTAARSNTIHPLRRQTSHTEDNSPMSARRPLSRTVAIPATKPKGMAARHTKERCPRREKGRSSEYTSLFLVLSICRSAERPRISMVHFSCIVRSIKSTSLTRVRPVFSAVTLLWFLMHYRGQPV